MLKIRYKNTFKKDFKRIKKRGYDIKLIDIVIRTIAEQKTLPKKYKDHNLTGNFNGYRECHIDSDWLLVYKINNDEMILYLIRTGSHSDLF